MDRRTKDHQVHLGRNWRGATKSGPSGEIGERISHSEVILVPAKSEDRDVPEEQHAVGRKVSQ